MAHDSNSTNWDDDVDRHIHVRRADSLDFDAHEHPAPRLWGTDDHSSSAVALEYENRGWGRPERRNWESEPEDDIVLPSRSAADHITMRRRSVSQPDRQMEALPYPPNSRYAVAGGNDWERELTRLAPGTFQAMFNPDHRTDCTVHLKLPITVDLDDELEEFSRLKRFGDFAAAKGYFRDHLESYHDYPYVFVQYAEMLLDMEDFASFGALNPSAVFDMSDRTYVTRNFAPPDKRHTPETSEALDLLRRYWQLLEAASLIRCRGMIHQALKIVNATLKGLEFNSGSGSTEVSCLPAGSSDNVDPSPAVGREAETRETAVERGQVNLHQTGLGRHIRRSVGGGSHLGCPGPLLRVSMRLGCRKCNAGFFWHHLHNAARQ
jgi:hypothetical protein